MLPDKINAILHDHPEITLDEIKRIPDILEDPVLILKSRNVGREGKANTRLVIFGSVKAKNGQPMLSVLDLRPNEKNLIIEDMQKLTSAYTKTQNPVEFIENSDIVYADKKRTTPLLRSIGFQMPIELNESGSIGSISYRGRFVNILGKNFSEIVNVNNGKDSADSNTNPENNSDNVPGADFASELIASIAEDSVGTDGAFIDRLVRGNESLAAKVINKIRDAVAALESRKSPEARAEYKRLKNAEKLFMSAVENADKRYVDGKIVADDEESKKIQFSRMNDAMFEEAAVEATKNYQATQMLETEAVSVSKDGNIKLQMKQAKKSSMSNSAFTKEEMLKIRADVVKHFNLKGINGFEQVQRGVLNTLKANGFFESNGERKVVIRENGMEVTINRGSIEETFGSGSKYESIPATFKILKLATIEQIPNIIENVSVVVEKEKNKYNNGKNKAFTHLNGTATIEGKSVSVRVTLKISKEKNKFWVHYVDVIKNTDDIFGLVAKNASPTDTKLSSAEDSVPQKEKIVKKQIKKSSVQSVKKYANENNEKVYTKKENPIIAAIKINGKGYINEIELSANILTSAYGKDNFQSFIDRNAEADTVFYWNEKKTQALFDILGLQLPDNIKRLASNIIIRKSRAFVNTKLKYSKKSSVQSVKKFANENNEKVYTKKEIRAMLKNVSHDLLSFEDGEYIIPVKLEFKEFNDKQNTLYVAISLEGIKKTEVSKQGTTENGVAQNSRSVTISIPDLIKKINPQNTNFTKYFPKSLLTSKQWELLQSEKETNTKLQYSKKSSVQSAKKYANENNEKVYTKKEIRAMLKNVSRDLLSFEDGDFGLVGQNQTKVVEKFFNAFNEAG